MNLCSDGHEEVCYESRNCPACEAIGQREEQLQQLNEKVAELETEVGDLEQRVAELRTEIDEN